MDGRGQRARVRLGIAFTLWAGASGTAQAGAWPQAPGATEVIATAAAKRYDSIPEQEFDIYAERGLSKRWTAVAGIRGWSRLESGRTFVQIGARREMKPFLGMVSATEARFLEGRDWNECGGWGLESRALAGRNFEIAGRRVFVDVETAARSFSDGCAEGRLELSAGSIVDRGAGFLLQANAEKIFGGFGKSGATERLQGQASLVYGLGHGLKIQAGIRAGFEDTGKREEAVLVGVWRKF